MKRIGVAFAGLVSLALAGWLLYVFAQGVEMRGMALVCALPMLVAAYLLFSFAFKGKPLV